jgi:hypothetical protein
MEPAASERNSMAAGIMTEVSYRIGTGIAADKKQLSYAVQNGEILMTRPLPSGL